VFVQEKPIASRKRPICDDDGNDEDSTTSTESDGDSDRKRPDGSTNENNQTIKNDASTEDDFDFIINGCKILANESIRKYHYCNIRTCKARFTVTTKRSGKEKKEYKDCHNHPAPAREENSRTSKAVKEKSLGLLKMGVTPSAVHKQLINNARSKHELATQSQVRQWKNRDKKENRPSGISSIPYTLLLHFIILALKS
jgi:hypothetical protein